MGCLDHRGLLEAPIPVYAVLIVGDTGNVPNGGVDAIVEECERVDVVCQFGDPGGPDSLSGQIHNSG